jgi:hypothetical protein
MMGLRLSRLIFALVLPVQARIIPRSKVVVKKFENIAGLLWVCCNFTL